ncbi:UNVERIFIED_CONTAM: Bacterial surface proteins containing Ig-like domains [Acetivibrio alkalicellulosi]
MKKTIFKKCIAALICIALVTPSFFINVKAEETPEIPQATIIRTVSDGFRTFVEYEYMGRTYRSDKTGRIINLRAWQSMDEESRMRVMKNYAFSPRRRKADFGEHGSDEMTRWVNGVTGWTEAREIWRGRIAARDFPELEAFYTRKLEDIFQKPSFGHIPVDVRKSQDYQSLVQEINSLEEEFNLGKEAYETLVRARAQQIGNAFAAGSDKLIPVIIENFMVGHITRGASYVSEAIATGFGFILDTIDLVIDKSRGEDPDINSIINDLWAAIEELENISERAKNSVEKRISNINDLEEKVSKNIEETLENQEEKKEASLNEFNEAIAPLSVDLPPEPHERYTSDIAAKVNNRTQELKASYEAFVNKVETRRVELMRLLGGDSERMFEDILIKTHLNYSWEIGPNYGLGLTNRWGQTTSINSISLYRPQRVFLESDYDYFKSNYRSSIDKMALKKRADADKLDMFYDKVLEAVDELNAEFKNFKAVVMGFDAEQGNAALIFGSYPERPIAELSSLLLYNKGTIKELADELREQADLMQEVKNQFYTEAESFENMINGIISNYPNNKANLEHAITWMVEQGEELIKLHEQSPYIIPLTREYNDWGQQISMSPPKVNIDYIERRINRKTTLESQNAEREAIISDLEELYNKEIKLLENLDTAEGHINYYQSEINAIFSALSHYWPKNRYDKGWQFQKNLDKLADCEVVSVATIFRNHPANISNININLYRYRSHSSNIQDAINIIEGKSSYTEGLQMLIDEIKYYRNSLLSESDDIIFNQKTAEYNREINSIRTNGLWFADSEVQKDTLRNLYREASELIRNIRWERYYVEVSDISIQFLQNEITSLDLEVGETRNLNAIVLPENSTYKGVTWESDSPSVIINQYGRLIASKATSQPATITVTSLDPEVNKQATIIVNVSEPSPPDYDDWHGENWYLEMVPERATLCVGDTLNLEVYEIFEYEEWHEEEWYEEEWYDDEPLLVDPEWLVWYSSNPNVASIDETTGTVTAHAFGVTVITARYDGYDEFEDQKAATCRIMVTEDGIAITKPPELSTSNVTPESNSYTNDIRPTIKIDVQEGYAEIDLDKSYLHLIQDEVVIAKASYKNGQFACVPDFDLVNESETGTFEVDVHIEDVDGNSDSYNWNFNIDTVKPVVEVDVKRTITSDDDTIVINILSDKELSEPPTVNYNLDEFITLSWDSDKGYYTGVYETSDFTGLPLLTVNDVEDIAGNTAKVGEIFILNLDAEPFYLGLNKTTDFIVSANRELNEMPLLSKIRTEGVGGIRLDGIYKDSRWIYQFEVDITTKQGQISLLAKAGTENGHSASVERLIYVDKEALLVSAYHNALGWLNEGDTFRVMAVGENINVANADKNAGVTAIFNETQYPMEAIGSAGIHPDTGEDLILYTTEDIAIGSETYNEPIKVQLIDKAGNLVSILTDTKLYADSTPPEISQVSIDTLLKDGSTFNLEITSNKELDLTSSNFSIGGAITGERLERLGDSYTYTKKVIIPEGLALDKAPITLRAMDYAGNETSQELGTLTVLNRPPVVSLISIEGTLGWNNLYNSDVTAKFKVEESDTTFIYWTYDYDPLDEEFNKIETKVDISSKGEIVEIVMNDDGEHQLFYMVEDSVGNRSDMETLEVNISKNMPSTPQVILKDLDDNPLLIDEGIYNSSDNKIKIIGTSNNLLIGVYEKISDNYQLISRIQSGESLIVNLQSGINQLKVKTYNKAGVPSDAYEIEVMVSNNTSSLMLAQNDLNPNGIFSLMYMKDYTIANGNSISLPELSIIEPQDGIVVSTTKGVIEENGIIGVKVEVETQKDALLNFELNNVNLEESLLVENTEGSVVIFIPLNHFAWQDSGNSNLNQLTVTATNTHGYSRVASVGLLYDVTPPVLVVEEPVNNFYTSLDTVIVSGLSDPLSLIEVDVNGDIFTSYAHSQKFSLLVNLQPGENQLSITSTDLKGNKSDVIKRTVVIDDQSLNITVESPTNTSELLYNLKGLLDKPTKSGGLEITLNNDLIKQESINESPYDFNLELNILPGTNHILIQATDLAGNRTSKLHTVTYDPDEFSFDINGPETTSEQTIRITGYGEAGAILKIYVEDALQSTNLIPETGEIDIPITLLNINKTNKILVNATMPLRENYSKEQELYVYWYEKTGASLSPTVINHTLGSEESVVIILNLNGRNLIKIIDGNRDVISDQDYSVSGDEYTIFESYLNSLNTDTTLTFIMDGGLYPTVSIKLNEPDADNDNGSPSSPDGSASDRSGSTLPVTEQKASSLKVVGEEFMHKEVTTREDGKTVESYTISEELKSELARALKDGKATVEIDITESDSFVISIILPNDVLKSAIGMNINISTLKASLEVPIELVEKLSLEDDDLTIQIESGDSVTVINKMKGIMDTSDAQVLGEPIIIKSAIKGDTNVSIPLSGINIPSSQEEQQAFLNTLRIFAIHSDGEKKIIEGDIVFDDKGNPGSISFSVDKFSTFAIIKLSDPKETQIEPLKIVLTIGQLEVIVNGSTYYLDSEPFIKPEVGRTLVPVRFIAETLGAEITWIEKDRQVIIIDNQNTIIFTIDSDIAIVNNVEHVLDCPAEIIPPGRTFIPLRFLSETLDAQVEYNHKTKEIIIIR